MTITVTGNLTDSLDNRLEGVEFRITSEISSGSTVRTAVGTYVTLTDGLYNFTLVNGIHKLEVRVGDTFEPIGNSIVDDSTPTPINIAELIKYTTPITPPVIIDVDPVWEQLFDDMRTDIDSFHQENREQIVDGNFHDVRVNDVYTNTRLDGGLSEERKESQANGATTTNQTLTYGDANLQEAAINTTETTVGSNKVSSADEVYSTSNGEVTTRNIANSNTPNSNVSNNTEVVDKGTDDVSMVLTLNHTTGKSLNKYSKELVDDSQVSRVSVTEELTTDKFGHTATSRDTYTTAIGYRDSSGIQLDEPISIEESTHNITSSFNEEASTSREHGALVDSAGVIQANITDSTTVNTKNGSESLTNDGSTTVKDFNVDKLNIGTDVFQLDTVAKKLTLNAQLVVGNPDDFKGDKGDTIFDVFKYSPSAADSPNGANWHETFTTGDIFRITNQSINGAIDPLTWTAPAKLAGEDGTDGDSEYYEYEYSVDSLSWHTTFTTNDIYRRERLVTDGVPAPWSAAARIRGVDGTDGDIVTIEYEYSIDGLTIWHNNFTTGDHYRHERTATYKFIGDPNPVYGSWSVAARLVPIKGIDYLDGVNGSGFYVIENATGVFPSDYNASDDFITFTGRTPVSDDYLTYVDDLNTPTASEVKRCTGAITDNSTTPPTYEWVAPSQIVDGDLLVFGSVNANRIVAKSITGGQVSSDTTIIAGNTDKPNVVRNLLVGALGTNYGYERGSYGTLDDETYRGADIQFLRSTPSGTEFQLVGIVTDIAPIYVKLGTSDEIVTLNWNGTDTFTSSDDLITVADVGLNLNLRLSATIGGKVPIAGINGDDTGTLANNLYKDVRFWAGSEFPRDTAGNFIAPMYVDNDGKLVATGAEFSGLVTASVIKGSEISGTNIYGGTIAGAKFVGSTFLYYCDPFDDGTTRMYYDFDNTISLQCYQNVLTNDVTTETLNSSHPWWGVGTVSANVLLKSSSDTTGTGVDYNRAIRQKIPAGAITGRISVTNFLFLRVRLIHVNTDTLVETFSPWSANFYLDSSGTIGRNTTVTVEGLTLQLVNATNTRFITVTSQEALFGTPNGLNGTYRIEAGRNPTAGFNATTDITVSMTATLDNGIVTP